MSSPSERKLKNAGHQVVGHRVEGVSEEVRKRQKERAKHHHRKTLSFRGKLATLPCSIKSLKDTNTAGFINWGGKQRLV